MAVTRSQNRIRGGRYRCQMQTLESAAPSIRRNRQATTRRRQGESQQRREAAAIAAIRAEPRLNPDGTLTQRRLACFLPDHLSPSTRYYLARCRGEDPPVPANMSAKEKFYCDKHAARVYQARQQAQQARSDNA